MRRRPVEDAMSYETICLDVATPIYRAAASAISTNVRRLLIEHRRLVGIVSCLDLVDVPARAGLTADRPVERLATRPTSSTIDKPVTPLSP
jgi:hypothetical protein